MGYNQLIHALQELNKNWGQFLNSAKAAPSFKRMAKADKLFLNQDAKPIESSVKRIYNNGTNSNDLGNSVKRA